MTRKDMTYKMGNDMKEHMKRHFSTYVIATNALIAISIAGLATLGALSGALTVPVLTGNALVFGAVYAVGKFGNDQLEDIPRLDAFEGRGKCSNTSQE